MGLLHKVKGLFYPRKDKEEKIGKDLSRPYPHEILEKYKKIKVNGDLERMTTLIEEMLGQSDDFVLRRFRISGTYSAVLFYFSNMVQQKNINEDILKPLMSPSPHLVKRIRREGMSRVLLQDILYHTEGQVETRFDRVIEAILRGETAVLVQGMESALLIGTRSIEKRAVDQPSTEQVIRGSRDGFIEQIGTNIALIRYRLQSPDFRIKALQIGRLSKTKVVLCYIEGIANPDLIEEVEDRVKSIDIASLQDPGFIEQYIEDNHMSPFPQVQITERSEKLISSLVEGRVGILCDGSPFALIVPAVFSQFYQTSEDYAERFLMGSMVRLIRLLAILFSLFFPALYVSVVSFNPELIPTTFAVAVASSRSGIPFPTVVEVFIMEATMEVLREATIRLPQQIGGALSIVGVLVIGQAAVSAGFASPITVVIIAMATIGSFATPAYNAAIAFRMLRFPILILSGIFGLFGVMVGFIFITNHLLSLKSFGVPYLSLWFPSI
ncbi:GerA spore germination protein [[Clostridium] ultunense Esp]|nr:GerA spore germination protein [[Clostridium] ultunense Esp]